MPDNMPRLPRLIFVLILLGTLAGLFGVYRRLHVENRNRRVEIGIEWNEIYQLAQLSNRPVGELLRAFQSEGVSTLIVNEDTLISLEQSGDIRPQRTSNPDGKISNIVSVGTENTFERIRTALQDRGFKLSAPFQGASVPSTTFLSPQSKENSTSSSSFGISAEYLNLRSLGLGLSTDALKAAEEVHLRIAGRIGNFAGVNETTAANVLNRLKQQGASTVIFNGDEVLGYRGLEKLVAELFRTSPLAASNSETPPIAATGMVYGVVEFGKQKGDEKISTTLHGDYVRVHSIQSGEMGTLEEPVMVDRFVKAVKERNIRFCYIRLLTQAGADAVDINLEYFHKIKVEMQKGSLNTGGGFTFGAAHVYAEPGIPRSAFLILGLGTGAAVVWMLSLLMPISQSKYGVLLLVSCLVLALLSTFGGEMGRKVTALAAGIVFPTAGCLLTLPGAKSRSSIPLTLPGCIQHALKSILLTTSITIIGILHVVGLLSTRPFMVAANQFLGIKLQHASPLLIVAFAVIMGGAAISGESWQQYRVRCREHLKSLMSEPVRYSTLFLGITALVLLLFIVVRSGNDSGMGVSSFELKTRSIMDHIFPVRPRTKELFGGHPAFILAIAWWWRGRTKMAIPCFIIGCLGQVSLLNTFCHIHTPLVISVWHGVLGLLLGSLLGVVLFLVLEKVMPEPANVKALAD